MKTQSLDNLQENYDNMPAYEDNKYQSKEDMELENLADSIEKEIIIDAVNYGDDAIEAMVNYLNCEDGVPDETILGLKEFIKDSLSLKSDNNGFDAFLSEAIRWQAEKEAKELI